MTQSLYQQIKRLLFPDRCPYCEKVIGFMPDCPDCAGALSALCLPLQNIAQEYNGISMLEQAAACYYYADPIKEAIHRLKFEKEKDKVEPFAKKMAQRVQDQYSTVSFDLAVFVPASKVKLQKRGYNVAQLLAAEICQILAIPLENGILVKEYETLLQHQLSAAKRRTNLIGAFSVVNKKALNGKTVLLVDDIFTTGATAQECAKMLRLAGADKVFCIAFAASRFGYGEKSSENCHKTTAD